MKWIVYCSIVMAASLALGSAQGDIKDDWYNRYGLDVDRPGYSCADIYEKNPTSRGKSGLYLIKTNDLFLAQCDMEYDYEVDTRLRLLTLILARRASVLTLRNGRR